MELKGISKEEPLSNNRPDCSSPQKQAECADTKVDY